MTDINTLTIKGKSLNSTPDHPEKTVRVISGSRISIDRYTPLIVATLCGSPNDC